MTEKAAGSLSRVVFCLGPGKEGMEGKRFWLTSRGTWGSGTKGAKTPKADHTSLPLCQPTPGLAKQADSSKLLEINTLGLFGRARLPVGLLVNSPR